MHTVDLRSDTKTRPTPEMREAMASADVGDDMDGEDPTTNRLEALAAEMLGKEDAVFVTSGTQGNLVSILSFCQRGDNVICGVKSHIYRAEAAGASALGSVAYHPLAEDVRGMLDPDIVAAAIQPHDQHYPGTGLIAIENTHNACGGAVLTQSDVSAVAKVARKHGLPLHVDGARIFNAAVHLETPVADLVKDADTVTFCLSKGLGAPVGSLVCGSRDTIDRARRWRKALGSAMRQSGVIAAAGIVALENMVERLADDHSNARKLAKGLAEIPGVNVDPEAFPTNLLFIRVNPELSSSLAEKLRERGVSVNDRPGGIWRLVTHADVSSDDIDYALETFGETFRD